MYVIGKGYAGRVDVAGGSDMEGVTDTWDNGAIHTFTIASQGDGYAVGDSITLRGGSGTAIITVAAVSLGKVTSAHVTTAGLYYIERNTYSQAATSGQGSGFQALVTNTGSLVWAYPTATRQWVDGYKSVLPQRFLYNLGNAGSCGTAGTQTASARKCLPDWTPQDPGWTQEDVWYVSWGADPSEPLPQIYNATNAVQWTQLSLYAYLNPQRHNGGNLFITGTLTEAQACATKADNTCPTLPPDRTDPDWWKPLAAQGWTRLYNSLNGSPNTAQPLPWSTDIKR